MIQNAQLKQNAEKDASGNNYNRVKNMVDINPNISIITLNVNGLYIPIKKQRLSG